jgi:hypothetical protein
VARPARSGPPPFSVGDKVKVVVSEDQLKTLQQGHGGWNPKMAEVRHNKTFQASIIPVFFFFCST